MLGQITFDVDGKKFLTYLRSVEMTLLNFHCHQVSMASEIETNMVGVERIKEYQEVKEEAPLLMPEQDPDQDWPKYGVVKFDNYQTRYREGLDLVLKGVDCHIRSGEKVGIVGRTGAGMPISYNPKRQP